MDDINDALISAVKAAGGSANIGPKIWPEKTPQAAQRLLLDCLNPDRPAHLTPEQVVFIARLARKRGHHGLVEFMADDLGYSRPTPIEPKDEMAELQRQFIKATEMQAQIVARMEQMQQPQLKRAA